MANYLRLLPRDILDQTLNYIPKIVYMVVTDDRGYNFHGIFTNLKDSITCLLRNFGGPSGKSSLEGGLITFVREVELGIINPKTSWKYQLTHIGLIRYNSPSWYQITFTRETGRYSF